MADQAKTTAIREAVQARLQTISVANGYRTNVGVDVRTEPSQFAAGDGPRVTIWPASRQLPESFKAWGERSLQVVIEVQVPVELETPLAELEAAEADIEQALEEFVLSVGAMPMRFVEAVTLDRPDGEPSMCSQLMFRTGYRQ